MIRDEGHSFKEQIRLEVLKEVQRILLSYENRLAELEKTNNIILEDSCKLKERIEELEDYIEAVEADVNHKIREVQ